jgi:hypothetical protein
MCIDVSEKLITFIFRVENQPSKKSVCLMWLSPAASQFLSRLIFDLQDEGDKFLRNVGSHTDYRALYPRRWQHL